MLEVADIFRRYGEEYLRAFGETLLPGHRRAFEDILRCRTPAMGGQVFLCDHCGHTQYSYHSCRHRSCPKCHTQDTEAWLQARRKELLPVPYFHLVFTLPEELRHAVRRHQKALYGLLMKTAAAALIKLARDAHYVGGLVGVLAVLHTWTRTLHYHPHVHCLVPAGGVSDDNHWRPARPGYLVPVRALSRIFRDLFRDGLAQLLPDFQTPAGVWKKDWVVYCKPTLGGPQSVLNYLGRYVHRAPIANSRLVSLDDGQVTFRYQECDDSAWKTMTLPAGEFIRRFLQHVLPSRVHKVRYYGLWSRARRDLLRQVQLVLAAESSIADSGQPTALPPPPTNPPEGRPCPRCHQGRLLWTGRLPRQQRAPP